MYSLCRRADRIGSPRLSSLGRKQSFAGILIAASGVFLLSACEREKRELEPAPASETAPAQLRVSELQPGTPTPLPLDPRRAKYEGNAYHVSEGKRLYTWFNCNGCHSQGGGGSGPALMDDEWRYGGELEQIFASIQQGRPNGMPAFDGKIPDQQIWEISAYVRSMSGNLSRSVAPGRNDDLAGSPPEQSTDKQPPKMSSEAASMGTAP